MLLTVLHNENKGAEVAMGGFDKRSDEWMAEQYVDDGFELEHETNRFEQDKTEEFQYMEYRYSQSTIETVLDGSLEVDAIDVLHLMLMDSNNDVHCFSGQHVSCLKNKQDRYAGDYRSLNVDLREKRFIVFPLNPEVGHWVSVVVDFKCNTIWCYNSTGWARDKRYDEEIILIM